MNQTLRQIHHAINFADCMSRAAQTLGVDHCIFRARLVQAGLSYEVLRGLPLEEGPTTYGDAYDKALAYRKIHLNTIPFSDVCDAVFATETVAAASCQLGVRAGALAIHLIKKGIDYDELKACDKSTALARWPDYDLSVTIKADLTRYTFAEIHAVIRETKTPTEAGKRLGGLRENTFRSQLARTGFRYALLKRWDEAMARKNIPCYDAPLNPGKAISLSHLPLALIHDVILETDTVTSAAINIGGIKVERFNQLLSDKGLSYRVLKGVSKEKAMARFGDHYHSLLKDLTPPSASLKPVGDRLSLKQKGFFSRSDSRKRLRPEEEEVVATLLALGDRRWLDGIEGRSDEVTVSGIASARLG